MTINTYFRHQWFFLLLLGTLLFLTTSCYGVSLQVKAGFDGVQKSKVWTPVAVQMTNTSDEDIEGVLLIDKPQGMKDELPMCTAAVSLPAHSNKLYHSYIKLPGYGGEITVMLVRGRSVLAEKKAVINPVSEDDKLVVSVGDRSSRLGFLQGETMPIPARVDRYNNRIGNSVANINAGSISASMLPDRPAAYEGVDVLIISDISPASTNPNSLKALGMWVASGGTLVISTGADYRRYIDDFYSDLLPVSINGAANLPAINSLTSFGRKQFPATPVAVAKSTVKPWIGNVLASDGGVPIVVERKYGVGRVIFLAFDYKSAPFKDWNGQTEFWKSILKMPASTPFVQALSNDPINRYNRFDPQEQSSNALSMVVSQRPSVKTPSFNTIGTFLLVYLLALVPVNYFFLKRRRRLELAWLTTPIIVLAFTVGAYAIGYTMKGGKLQLNEAVLIEGSSNARYARSMADASLFSPARRSYNVLVSDPMAITQTIRSEENETLPITYIADKSTVSDVSMAMWSSKNFENMSGVDLGGVIDSQLVLAGNRIKGKITNNTAISFMSCIVIYGGNSIEIPTLRPGKSENIDIAYKANSSTSVDPYSTNLRRLDNKLFSFAQSKSRSTGTPMLIAAPITNTDVFDLPDNDPSIKRATQYAFHLDYIIGSGIFKLTPDMVDGRIIESDNVSRVPGNRVVGSFMGIGYYVASFHLPVSASSNVSITSLKVDSNLASVHVKGATASIFNYRSGKWEPLSIHIGDACKAYIGVGNDVRVKVEYDGNGSGINIGVGISVEGKRL